MIYIASIGGKMASAD